MIISIRNNTLLKIQSSFLGFAPAVVIALMSAASNCRAILRKWEFARGYEYEWIGRAIAKGHGFSFPGDSRWLFPKMDPNQFFPTAWSEPFSPFFIGANLYLFGEYGKLCILFTNAIFSFLTGILLFWIVKKKTHVITGYFALIAFILLPTRLVSEYLGNSVFAGFLILLFFYIAVGFLNHITWIKSILVGFFLGLMALTHAGTLLFTPAFSIYVVLWNKLERKAILNAVLLALIAGITVFPWTLRNYLTFGEFVPVRNGIGQILHVSNLSLGRTTQPLASETEIVPLPWRSKNIWEAYKKINVRDNRRALERYSENLIASEIGADYLSANEVERDKYLSAAAKQYVLAHPVDTIILSMIKGAHFFFINWPQFRYKIPIGSIITLIAGIGALTLFRKKEVSVAAMCVFCYSAPYLLTAPYFYRYRYPIEPLLIILFSHVIASAFNKSSKKALKNDGI